MAPRLSQPPDPVPRFDAEIARKFLAYILDTEAGVCEIRVFRAWLDRSGYVVPSTSLTAVMAGWYDNVHDMIVDLGKLKGVSAYITINPVVSDLFARCANKLRNQKTTTNDGNIVIFRWLYVDIDPKRPADISSTNAELALAVKVRDRILTDHPVLASAAIWGKSGNGAWILVLLPDYLPEEGHDLAAQALAWISATYSDEAVKIDVVTKNPSRVGVIPGTVKCKGDHVANRPHRMATLDSPNREADDPLMPCDLRAWLEDVGADQAAQQAAAHQNNGATNGHATGHPGGPGGKPSARFARNEVDRIYRASCYLDAMAPAISGQGGHDQTFDAACALVLGFGLSISEARPILGAWNLRCQPPWSDQELEHKLADADQAVSSRPRGYLFDASHDDDHSHDHANGQVNSAVIPQPPQAGKLSPVVAVTPVEIVVNNQVCDLLNRHDGLYQRNYRLVEIACQPQDQHRRRIGIVRAGTPMIVQLEGPRLREIISSVASFRIGTKPAHPPDWCVSALLHRRYWSGIPVLTGVVEHPTLRPDGSMMEGIGYDEETGILCASNDEFLPVAESPSRAEAQAAAGRLLDLVEEFPFQGHTHRVAWLACLLTILNRHLIDDAVPLFLFEATTSGSGKTLLCDLVSRIITGRDMVRGAYYHDAIEMDKRIVSTALEGLRVTMLDNVEGAFGNSSLDNALTGRWYQGRVLGQSQMTAPLLLDSVFVATGNNISFHGDVFRRIVPCRLESPYERPDREKTEFAIADIREYVIEHRTELLRDALTITRAYLQAGCPHELPLNVYGAWTRLIRGAVIWTTSIDPMEGQRELAEADMARMSRASFVDGFVQMLQELNRVEMTGGEILTALGEAMYQDRFDDMREAMSAMWTKPGPPSVGSLGKRLMSMRGARSGNYRIVKTGMNKHTAKWGVQWWSSADDSWTDVQEWANPDQLDSRSQETGGGHDANKSTPIY